MALTAVSRNDIIKRLNHSGLSGKVQATQVVEAAKLFFNSELPSITELVEPLYLRQSTLILRSRNSIAAAEVKAKEPELIQYLNQSCGTAIQRLYFQV